MYILTAREALKMIEYTVKVYDNGNKEWFLNDQRHREDGPAIQNEYGDKAWFLNGKRLTKEEWENRMKNPNRAEADEWAKAEWAKARTEYRKNNPILSHLLSFYLFCGMVCVLIWAGKALPL